MTTPNKSDRDFEVVDITEVSEEKKGYSIRRDDGWSFYIAKQYDDTAPHGIVPRAGDRARFYGRGIGSQVRGVSLFQNGAWRVVYYHSEEEQERRNHAELITSEARQLHEYESRDKATLDREYDELPDVFKRRLDKFRANNPDFRWKYERYEMFCCTEAVKLAGYLRTPDAMQRYTRAEWEEQKTIDRAAGLALDEHSGNTHGAAVALASWFLNEPEAVVKMHGALAPLVGSKEYGCVPRDEGEQS